MGRPKKIHMLQANDAMQQIVTEKPQAVIAEVPKIFMSEEEIREAAAPYVSRGMKLDISEDHWYLTMHKEVRNIHGKVIGGGNVKVAGTRSMPVKDLIYSANELMIPITPITPNPAA